MPLVPSPSGPVTPSRRDPRQRGGGDPGGRGAVKTSTVLRNSLGPKWLTRGPHHPLAPPPTSQPLCTLGPREERPHRDHRARSPQGLAAWALAGRPACDPACDGPGERGRGWGWAAPSPAAEAKEASGRVLCRSPCPPRGTAADWPGTHPQLSSTQALTLRGLGEGCGVH